jgi:hypothetical protein
MAKKQRKNSKARSVDPFGKLPADLQAIVDQVIGEMRQKLGITEADDLESADHFEIDWLALYSETLRFLPTGYRLQTTTEKTRHRMGGRRRTGSPSCGCCGTPLILFADLDASDRLLRGDHQLTRLPLYYCCSCPGPVYYQIADDGDVRVIPSKRERWDETPFEKPAAVQAGYLTLKPINPEIEKPIYSAVKLDGFDSLTKAQLGEISTLLGRRPRGRWEMYFSQVGGVPISFQGDEGKPRFCPNRDCDYRLKRREEFKFRPLAVLDLWNDHFWLVNRQHAVQIVYHICPGCHCVSAKYTCT